MKLKHNKKRNTAFIFEALVKELTKSVIKKNDAKKRQIAGIIKEHFKNDSIPTKYYKKVKDSMINLTSNRFLKSKAI